MDLSQQQIATAEPKRKAVREQDSLKPSTVSTLSTESPLLSPHHTSPIMSIEIEKTPVESQSEEAELTQQSNMDNESNPTSAESSNEMSRDASGNDIECAQDAEPNHEDLMGIDQNKDQTTAAAAAADDDGCDEASSADEDIGASHTEQLVDAAADSHAEIDEQPQMDESIEEDFVAIELVDSGNNDITTTRDELTTHDTHTEEQAILLDHDQLQPPSNNNTLPSHNINITANNKIRKKLRHPILTPLAKLPWEKFATAAGTCDLLFNCKYSMRQVEDEVREEKKTIQYDDVVGEGEEYYEDDCDADCDVQELGLHCCSMMEDSDDEGVDGGEGNAARENNVTLPCEDAGNLLVTEEQKRKSWKGSNPTIDMMLYRQFLEE
eukprot:scaffold91719_cov43-Cyclotella_meneghiniana.AAC.2